MTKRLTLGALALPGLGAGLLIGAPELVAVAAALGLAAALSGWAELRGRSLRVEVGSAARARAGKPLTVHLRLVNQGARRLLPTAGNLRADGAHIAARHRITIPPLARNEPHTRDGVELTFDRRGEYELSVLVGDVLGLAVWPLRALRRSSVLVHPRQHQLPSPHLGGTDDDGAATSGGLAGGEAFQYLRGYVPGDDVRLIHWRASAAHGMTRGVPWPVVRHQVVVEDDELVVHLDTARASYTDAEAFEQAVEVAASLLQAGLTTGTARLVLGGSRTIAVPVATEIDEVEAMDHLAKVEMTATGGVPPVGDLGPTLPRRATAVLVTGSSPASGAPVVEIALGDLGITSTTRLHIGGAQSPAGLGPDDRWFPTAVAMAEGWNEPGHTLRHEPGVSDG